MVGSGNGFAGADESFSDISLGGSDNGLWDCLSSTVSGTYSVLPMQVWGDKTCISGSYKSILGTVRKMQ